MYTLLNKEGFVIGCQLDEPTSGLFTELLVVDKFIKPKIKSDAAGFIEGATTDEIAEEIKKSVPQTLSRMKFIIQVFISLGIKYDDIILFIQNLNIDENEKYIILTKLRSVTDFNRNSIDLQNISSLMQISETQLDEIFINGNKI